MFKHVARNIIFALILTPFFTPAIHASNASATPATSTTPPPISPVTGGDPEPISPDVIQMVLVFVYLA